MLSDAKRKSFIPDLVRFMMSAEVIAKEPKSWKIKLLSYVMKSKKQLILISIAESTRLSAK
jgi:hypothetical protein